MPGFGGIAGTGSATFSFEVNDNAGNMTSNGRAVDKDIRGAFTVELTLPDGTKQDVEIKPRQELKFRWPK